MDHVGVEPQCCLTECTILTDCTILTASERLSMGVWHVEWVVGLCASRPVAGISACVAAVLGPLSRGLCPLCLAVCAIVCLALCLAVCAMQLLVRAQSNHLCPSCHPHLFSAVTQHMFSAVTHGPCACAGALRQPWLDLATRGLEGNIWSWWHGGVGGARSWPGDGGRGE